MKQFPDHLADRFRRFKYRHFAPNQDHYEKLAAEGQTNRDIAQTLYVTPKTVEVHLTSVYRKLGISTRATLPEALAHNTA